MASWSNRARSAARSALSQVPLVGGLLSRIPGRATGGPVSAGQPYWVGERGEPELFVPRQSGTIVPLSDMSRGEGGASGPVVNITINGDVVDREAFIRQIVQNVNRSIAAPNTLKAW